MVTLAEFGHPVEAQSFDTFKLFGYPVLVYPIKLFQKHVGHTKLDIYVFIE